jgi:hypothetical protein
MHLLLLTSTRPCTECGTAANVVLASLMFALAELGHTVSWAIAWPDDPRDEDAERRLREKGVRFLGDFSADMEAPDRARPWRTFETLRKAAWPGPDDDLPRFRDPSRTARALGASGADIMILFWDSWFEHLLPALSGRSAILYGGRPRHAAAMARLANGLRTPGVLGPLRDTISLRLLRAQEKRHYGRLAAAGGLANICATDAAIYRSHGLDCTYVPNTWPDAFGRHWQAKRAAARSSGGPVRILGNVSAVTATGNLFGMRYLGREVLPLLDRDLCDIEWSVNVTGGGALADDLKRAFDRPRVQVKGFVPDLDAEILSNDIFLLLNNAGPYTGGYTRVVYAMSAGSCLIAHRRLADSMPEVRHGENALLGETAAEIADHVAQASRDPALRHRLGENARQTYERDYCPEVVARRLVGLAGDVRGA